jgi:hypothetical protein
MSRLQKAGQNPNIKIGNKSFENVAKSKCFGTTIRNENFTHEESKCRLHAVNEF